MTLNSANQYNRLMSLPSPLSPYGQLAESNALYRACGSHEESRTARWWGFWRTHEAAQTSPQVPISADGPAVRDERLRRLEAVFMLSKDSLSSKRLAEFCDLADGREARTLVRQLNKIYDRVGTAFRVEEVAGGFKLMTRVVFAKWMRRLFGENSVAALSTPLMETLTVVAYRQPVTRADVEAVRGVRCGEILRQLMERDLVRIAGRSEELGRPFLYGTTKTFLSVFGLRKLSDLPRRGQMSGSVPN